MNNENNKDSCCSFLNNKGQAMTYVFVVLAILLAIYSVSGLVDLYKKISKNDAPTNVISVSAQGEAFAKPDVAQFTVSTTEDALTVADAQQKANDKIDAVIKLAKAAGVEDKDIKTVDYSINPKYEYESICPQVGGSCKSKTVFKGYSVTQAVEVKVRKIETAGKILTDIGETGVTNISGLSFVVDNSDKIREGARNEAITKAQEKAQILAKKLGVSLVRVTSFYEDSPSNSYYSKYGMGDVMMSAAPMAKEVSIQTGENKYTSNVSITYEIK